MRKLLLLAVLVCGIAAPASAAARGPYTVAWRRHHAKIVRYAGRFYAEWQCDVGGTVVATGIFWVWLSPPSAVVGALAGASFTTGCHIGAPTARPVYYEGVPRERNTLCWMTYPHGSYKRRFVTCFV